MSDNQWGPPQQPPGGQYPQQPPPGSYPGGQYPPPGQFAPPPPWQPGPGQYPYQHGGRHPNQYGGQHGNQYGGQYPNQYPNQYGGQYGPGGQLPHGLGWGHPPPGGPRPPKKRNPAVIALVVLGFVGAGIVGLAVAVSGLGRDGDDPDLSRPEPTLSRPTNAPTAISSVGPSDPVASSVPTVTRPTATRPTAPRTTTTPKRKAGPTNAQLVSRNRLYASGTMASVGCEESRARPSTTAGARANYVQLRACLSRAWPAQVRRAGFTFRSPAVRPFVGTVQSPCGAYSDSGPPFYCPANETIYMNLREDLGNYNRYTQRYQKIWARMWMLHQFAHEYGHHVQKLTGIIQANHALRYEAPTRAAGLELTRRLELQASCFSDIFIGSNKSSYPVTGEAKFQWNYLIGHVTDRANDHGDPSNHRYWALRGYDTRNPAACNTFTAPSARVR